MAEACYKEPYLPGSFKFIPFKAIEASSEHGRRGAEGEFPFGEVTGYADLGRRIRTYSISARFDGNNHVLMAAALIAVCELPGPGILVHPTRGVIVSAAIRSLRVTDKVEDEQGVTYVDMDFVEANVWPNSLSLVGQLLGLVLGLIIGTSRNHFRSSYKIAEIQSFRRIPVVSAAQQQMLNIRREYVAIPPDPDDLETRNSIINDMTIIATEYDAASDTETMDRGLALGMQAVADQLEGVAKFNAFRRLANGAAKQSSFGAPASLAENAIYSNVRVIAASYMSQAVLESDELNTGQIFDQIDVTTAIFDQELQYARGLCDNDLFLEIGKFRDSSLAKMYDKAYNAPGVKAFNFSSGVLPVVAAYSIYGDAKRHRELEQLNVVRRDGKFAPSVAASLSGA